jgi:hypothetical protein
VTNIQGSATYDGTLGDTAMIEQLFAEAKAKQSAKVKESAKPEEIEARPPRRGYSREVEAIYDLVDNIVALRGEMGRWSASNTERVLSKRPWFPSEVVAERMRKRSIAHRDEAIARAQANWKARHDAARKA